MKIPITYDQAIKMCEIYFNIEHIKYEVLDEDYEQLRQISRQAIKLKNIVEVLEKQNDSKHMNLGENRHTNNSIKKLEEAHEKLLGLVNDFLKIN